MNRGSTKAANCWKTNEALLQTDFSFNVENWLLSSFTSSCRWAVKTDHNFKLFCQLCIVLCDEAINGTVNMFKSRSLWSCWWKETTYVVLHQWWENLYYHGVHELWNIAGEPPKIVTFILKFCVLSFYKENIERKLR